MFGGVLSVLLASLTCQLPEICEAPVTGVPDTSSIFGEEISRQLQSLYQEKQEAPSVTFTLTLMICPRPGFSRGSGCNAPDHTPVQLIITSAPPLATWQQRTEQVAWEGVRALVSPAPSFPLSSALQLSALCGTAGRRLNEESKERTPNLRSAIYLLWDLRNVPSPPQGSAAFAIK